MTKSHDTDGEQLAAFLNPNEARVLACLMEKELTVPDSYPLTLNSLTLACNQKSNRDPVMNLPEGEVGHLAKELMRRELVNIEYGERAHRFEHKARQVMVIDSRQQAVLTVLLLRGPQTLNEIKVRTKRMVNFETNDAVLSTLESLNEFGEKRMQVYPKGHGQREDRYSHLLCGEAMLAPVSPPPAFTPPEDTNKLDKIEAKIDALTKRVAELENKLSEP